MTTAPPAPTSRPSASPTSPRSASAFRVLSVAWLDLAATLRRPMWWAWIALLAIFALVFAHHGMPVLPSGGGSGGGKHVWVTSQFAIAGDTVILAILIHAFFITIIAGLTVIRDEEYQIGEILHATPLTGGSISGASFWPCSPVSSS